MTKKLVLCALAGAAVTLASASSFAKDTKICDKILSPEQAIKLFKVKMDKNPTHGAKIKRKQWYENHNTRFGCSYRYYSTMKGSTKLFNFEVNDKVKYKKQYGSDFQKGMEQQMVKPAALGKNKLYFASGKKFGIRGALAGIEMPEYKYYLHAEFEKKEPALKVAKFINASIVRELKKNPKFLFK